MAPAPDAKPPPAADRSRTIYLRPWRIELVHRAGVPKVLAGRTIARAAASALATGGAPSPGSLTVVLTDDAELEELNATHLGEAGPTDVLSFPMLPSGAFPVHPGRSLRRGSRRVGDRAVDDRGVAAAATGPRGRIHLGDIAISVERAMAQAESGAGGQTGDVRWSPADELRLLVIHGALHICGWDHAKPVEEAAMRALERRLLLTPS